MHELWRLIWCGLIGFFRSRAALEAEILVLRHQLNVLRRKSPKRPTFGSIDRLIFAGLYGLAPRVLSALAIVRPETVIRWHRAGFRLYWRWFLRNHADGIASLDLFVVPTISFQLLYGLLILKHGRREILWLTATAHPSAEWISRQLMEAYGWEEGPAYLVRDRDSVYGEVFIRRLRAMGIRDRPTAPRSPWQNGYCERLLGSIRRDALTISW
jgi:transposase InsO family protein